jgi:hypothetical protein
MKGSKKRSIKKPPKQEAVKAKVNKKFILFICLLILFIGALGLAYNKNWWPFKIKNGDGSPKPTANTTINTKKTAFETPENFTIRKISDTYKVPVEVFDGAASRALPMTAESRKIIHDKYLPDMVGIPKTGESFRLPLERDIDESLLKEILKASVIDLYEYEDVVFIKTVKPDVVFGVVTRISGEMIDYCDFNIEECTPIEIFFYNGYSKQVV